MQLLLCHICQIVNLSPQNLSVPTKQDHRIKKVTFNLNSKYSLRNNLCLGFCPESYSHRTRKSAQISKSSKVKLQHLEVHKMCHLNQTAVWKFVMVGDFVKTASSRFQVTPNRARREKGGRDACLQRTYKKFLVTIMIYIQSIFQCSFLQLTTATVPLLIIWSGLRMMITLFAIGK